MNETSTSSRFWSSVAILSVFMIGSAILLAWEGPAMDSLDELVARHSRENRIDPDLVHAVIQCESGGRPEAVSRAGAMGLMQVMPSTAVYIAGQMGLPKPSRTDLLDPEINIRFGTWYLAAMRDKFHDDHLALGAYNAGPANVMRWMGEEPGRPGDIVIRHRAYPETRAYVARVMETWHSRKQ